jgi:transposase
MARESKRTAGRFVGIDLGKRTHNEAFVSKSGKVEFSNGGTSAEGRQALYKKLRAEDTVALEAGNLAFIMAKEMEKAAGCKVLVLNPGNLAVIYRSMKKTDKEDSLKLAHLVQYMPEEQLPVVPVPGDRKMEMSVAQQLRDGERETGSGKRQDEVYQPASLAFSESGDNDGSEEGFSDR